MINIARNAVSYDAVVCINEFTADHLTFYLIRTLLQPSYALDWVTAHLVAFVLLAMHTEIIATAGLVTICSI